MSTAEAQNRLRLAFERLEAAARRTKNHSHREAVASVELEKIRAELARSLRDYDALETKAAGVSDRLDAVVVRLEGVLEDRGD